MELSEEKQLKQSEEEYAQGMVLFKERQYREAQVVFNRIIAEYKDSSYYSILEINGRAVLYSKLCEMKLNPVIIPIEDDEDYLFDGIYHLNARNLDKAMERFNYLEEKKYSDPFLVYLISLVHARKGNYNECLKYLKMAIDKDEFYKILAYNEPDYEYMFDNDAFTALVEAKTGEM